MKVDKYKVKETFNGEDGESLTVRYDNRGDPYRQGVGLNLDLDECGKFFSIFLESGESKRLRDLLLKLYPIKQ